MTKIGVVNFMTLDGVMQSPGSRDEDPSGGFEYGGWVIPYLDETWGKFASEGVSATGSLLFGRLTYQKMEAHWPNVSDDDPVAAKMNHSKKYVVSKTLNEVTWENAELLKGDAAEEIKALKEESRNDITILGSGELIRTLMQHGLIDQFTLLVCPIVLGTGKRLFKDGIAKAPLTLVDSTPTETGALIVTYRLP
jgi:dihydrofolate reductase